MSTATLTATRGSKIHNSPSLDVETVVRTYFMQIYRAARGAGLRDEQAEDVTQETFATLVEKAETFEGRSQVRTWLFGILYNKLREHRRSLDRDQQQISIDSLDEAFDESLAARFDEDGRWSRPPRAPDAEVAAQEIRSMIADCMESAPIRQRLAFVFRELEDLPSEEICKILGISSTNLGVMLHRFRNRVRNCLEAKGVA